MNRIVIGIFILCFFFLGILGNIGNKEVDLASLIFGGSVIFLIPGILLIYFGFQSRKKKQLVEQEKTKSNSLKSTVKENEVDVVSVSVNRLVYLYINSPGGEGFVKDSDSASEVRYVGQKLNEVGGFKLMLKTHEAFTLILPRAARNLEFVWGGIGSWQG